MGQGFFSLPKIVELANTLTTFKISQQAYTFLLFFFNVCRDEWESSPAVLRPGHFRVALAISGMASLQGGEEIWAAAAAGRKRSYECRRRI